MQVQVQEKRSNRKLLIIVTIVFVIVAAATAAVIVALAHEETVGDVLSLGDRYMSEMDYKSAIREYRRAIEIEPNEVEPYLKLAEAYIASGDLDGAIKALREGYDATHSRKILKKLNELTGGSDPTDPGGASPSETPDELTVNKLPNKTEYRVGETLDMTGASFTVKYGDGHTEEITEGYTCPLKKFDEPGEVTVSVTYGGKTEEFTVTVVDKVVTEVEIDRWPEKRSYYVGDSMDLTGMELLVTYENGETEIVTEGFDYENGSFTAPGTYEVTVSYGDKEVTVTVDVYEAELLELYAASFPEKRLYAVGEKIDLTGFTATGRYSDGRERDITGGFRCEPEYFNEPGTHTVTVYYGEYTVEFEVEVSGDLLAQGMWGDLSWKLMKDGTLSISGSGAMNDFSASDTGAAWKSYSLYIKSVIFSDEISSIGARAFEDCSGIASADLPEGINQIGYRAFNNCSNLTEIVIPEGVREIGQWTFAGCRKLTSVTLPGELNQIYSAAFDGCSSLRKIDIPNSVSWIGWRAFRGCSSLSTVRLGSSIWTIETDAFADCTALTDIYIESGSCSVAGFPNTLGDPAKTTLHAPESSSVQNYANNFGYSFEAIGADAEE